MSSMTRKISAALLALVLAVMPSQPLGAARGPDTVVANRLELVVIEVAGCTVCDLVRLYIQPAYEASPRARDVPMRYVDITNIDETKIGLVARVSTVPTIVLMRDGLEVDRISGYTGPNNFFAALSQMLAVAAD